VGAVLPPPEWSSGSPSGIARNDEFVEPAQAGLGRPVPFAKIFLFSAHPNHPYIRRHPVPLEGRIAIVADVGRGIKADLAVSTPLQSRRWLPLGGADT
jgi:hypothetical protein